MQSGRDCFPQERVEGKYPVSFEWFPDPAIYLHPLHTIPYLLNILFGQRRRFLGFGHSVSFLVSARASKASSDL
jgi:hypothetical protein